MWKAGGLCQARTEQVMFTSLLYLASLLYWVGAEPRRPGFVPSAAGRDPSHVSGRSWLEEPAGGALQQYLSCM